MYDDNKKKSINILIPFHDSRRKTQTCTQKHTHMYAEYIHIDGA